MQPSKYRRRKEDEGKTRTRQPKGVMVLQNDVAKKTKSPSGLENPRILG